MKVISKFFPDYEKCGGCNWSVTVRYSFEGNDINTEGLCGDCFMDMIVEEGYDITAGT